MLYINLDNIEGRLITDDNPDITSKIGINSQYTIIWRHMLREHRTKLSNSIFDWGNDCIKDIEVENGEN